MSKKELTMLRRLSTAEKHVKTMLAAVKHDPFVKGLRREGFSRATRRTSAKLRAAFDPADLSFEERHDLISELEAGWTTGEQYKIIDELKYRT